MPTPLHIEYKKPNILLVLTDQQRFDTIQALGSKFAAKTPAMDSLVRDGISFDNAFCTAPICSPSRATIMTGLFPSQVGIGGLVGDPCPPLSTTIMTIGKRLQQAGYETLYHGKWHLGGDIKKYGFETAVETSLDEETRLLASSKWRERDWIENAYRPFFHVVSFLNPHDHYFFDPNDKVPGFKRPWPKDSAKLVEAAEARRAKDWSEEKWGAYFKFYETLLERVDGEVGELLHQFRCNGFFSNSWIIFSSDHGDMAGEHDMPFKGSFMFEGNTRVPLVIVPPLPRFAGPSVHRVEDPQIAPGRREQLCSLLDIVPTILDLAQIEKPDHLPGNSLLPILRDGKTPPPATHVFAELHRNAVRMCRSTNWKYILYLSGEEQLFDLASDPNELHNLASEATHSAKKKEMRAALEGHFARTNDPFYSLKDHEFIFNPGKIAE